MRTSDASRNVRLGYRLAAYTAVLFAVVGFMVLSAATAAANDPQPSEETSNEVGDLLARVLQQAIGWGRWAVIIIVVWRVIKEWKGSQNADFPFMSVGKILLAGAIILYLMSWQGLTTLTEVGSGAGKDLAGIEEGDTVAAASKVFTKHS